MIGALLDTTAIVVLLGLNAFFVAAEFALLASRRSRMTALAEDGNRAAVAALASLRELSLTMAGAQLGITLASLALGAVAEPTIAHGLEGLLGRTALPEHVAGALGLGLGLTVVTVAHIIIGELAPKSWAISHPERSALLVSRLFRGFTVLVRPIIFALNGTANGIVRLLGQQPQNELALAHSPEDLGLLLDESAAHGLLDHDQQALLSRAIDLDELDAESAMVPRGDIVAVDAATGIAELEHIAGATGRSRIPVYDGDLDQVRGVLHVKDLLAVDADRRDDVTAGTLARPALVTPESRPLRELLVDMRAQRQHVAMVLDEYGGVSGLVTMEDLLEELIGNFEDESDRSVGGIRTRPGGVLVLPGSLRPHELDDASGIALPDGPWETLAGYVLAQLGRLPAHGDRVATDIGVLRVTGMDGYRITEVELQPR
ncbi:MAG: hemolysin family protein [Actinobacteria bacterium]|nr:hemolysin family protein [Actinomycetota bacterium]